MTHASLVDAILEAIERSERSDRQISLSSCGHASAVSNLKSNRDARLSTAQALCEDLGLEIYAGPRRRELDVNAIAVALGLAPHASLQDLLEVIDRLRGSESARRALRDAATLIQQGVDQVDQALQKLRSGH